MSKFINHNCFYTCGTIHSMFSMGHRIMFIRSPEIRGVGITFIRSIWPPLNTKTFGNALQLTSATFIYTMYKVKMRILEGKDTIYKLGWVNLKTFYKGRTNQLRRLQLEVAKYVGRVGLGHGSRWVF